MNKITDPAAVKRLCSIWLPPITEQESIELLKEKN